MPTTNATNTKLLLHCDGVDASTTFTDSSTASVKTVTAEGNGQVDTAQSKFGGASLLCDGTGDGLSIPDHADWAMGTGNFTVDFWVRFAAIGTEDGLIANSNAAFGVQDVNDTFDLRIDGASSSNLQVLIYSAGTNTISMAAAHGMVTDTWYHIAIIRGWGGNANDWAITVAGSSIVTLTDADPWPDFSSGFY